MVPSKLKVTVLNTEFLKHHHAMTLWCVCRKSISQSISDADDSNWIKPEVDPVKEEEDRQRSIERTKKGFKRRTAAQSVHEKYRPTQTKTLT